MLFFSQAGKHLDEFQQDMENTYRVKVNTEIEEFLGVQLSFSDSSLRLSQAKKIKTLIDTFDLTEGKLVDIPMQTGLTLEPDTEQKMVNTKPYQSIVGSLFFTARCVRGDILHAVNQLTRCMSAPTIQHYRAAKRVARYLMATKDYSLTFRRSGRVQLKHPWIITAYCDANYKKLKDNYCTIGGVIYLNNNLYKYSCKKLSAVIPQSTCEAEFLSIHFIVKQVQALRNFLQDLGLLYENPVIWNDNESAIAVALSKKVMKRVEHIILKYLKIRKVFRTGEMELHHIASERNIADGLTKNLPCRQFCVFGAALLGD